MKECISKGKDCAWLAQQLKNQIGSCVSFNKFGIESSTLQGVYDNAGIGGPYFSDDAVRFYIKFCRGKFLRIQIETGFYENENIATAMNELIKALALIKEEDVAIGYPLAIYETDNALTSEYAFENQQGVIEALKNDTMFDDGHIKQLRFLGTCNNCVYGSNVGHNTQTQENETCSNHEFEDGQRPDIMILCKSICDNKQ